MWRVMASNAGLPESQPVMLRWLWVSAVVLLLDQTSKMLADTMLALYQSVDVIPSLAIRLAYNSGAAFSFLSDASGWQRWFFVVLSAVVIVILIVWLTRLPSDQAVTALALALILGGAAGNLVDRVLYGHVIDFIDVYYGSWHWPTFNVADSAISIGAFLLLLDAFRGRKDKPVATR
jgi:signal peptidase II